MSQLKSSILQPFSYSVPDLFILSIRFGRKRTKITMTVLGDIVNTRNIPETYTILNKLLPQIFLSKCFNDDRLTFKTEVQRTEIGHLFEHFVGLEIIRIIRASQKRYTLRYWRDPAGPEVDWVIEADHQYIPIEVKWTDLPTLQDAKHLHIFLSEYPEAEKGYIVCQVPRVMKLEKNIYALPWKQLTDVFQDVAI